MKPFYYVITVLAIFSFAKSVLSTVSFCLHGHQTLTLHRWGRTLVERHILDCPAGFLLKRPTLLFNVTTNEQ